MLVSLKNNINIHVEINGINVFALGSKSSLEKKQKENIIAAKERTQIISIKNCLYLKILILNLLIANIHPRIISKDLVGVKKKFASGYKLCE